MKLCRATLVISLIFASSVQADEGNNKVKESQISGPNGLTIKVRMQGPYDMDTPLQIVCYLRHKPEGDKTLGAAVELDKRLHGAIASLRNRGEFIGDDMETILLTPPPKTITPGLLLLVGLGDEDTLSLQRLEGVGRVSLREAARLGVNRVAFAPLIRDQGNAKFSTGDVASHVLKAALLAHDTEKRLHKEGLARDCAIEEWVLEAGPQFFDETVDSVRAAVEAAKVEIAKRETSTYANRK